MRATVQKTFASGASQSGSGASFPSVLKLNPAGQTVDLRDAQFLRLRNARGWTVRALSGSVWVTQDNDLRDVVLEAGQSFVLDRSSPALLSPIGDAQVSLVRDGCRRPVQRHPLLPWALARATFA